MRKLTPLSTWIRLLTTWPFPIRLIIVVTSFLVSLGIYAVTFPHTHQGNILSIPIIMAAWMFKKRGLLITLGCLAVPLIVYHTHRIGSFMWPSWFDLSVLSGIIILLFIGFAIAALRDFVDASDIARQQAQQTQKQLTLAYEQQRQLNALKTQFIMNVNHELRTPLTVIMGSLEICQLILEQQGSLELTAHGQYLQMATEQSEKLRDLVEDVLDTKIINEQSIAFAKEEIVIAPLVHEIIDTLDAKTRQSHPIMLDIPEHLTVLADRQGMLKVLSHLLSNASKYSPAGTPITITAKKQTSTRQKADCVHCVSICVQDRGRGIPPDQLSSIFDQFARLNRDIGGAISGNGLGLYICKALVDAMNGHLWAESTGIAGEGSCFCFTLPLSPSQRSDGKGKQTSMPGWDIINMRTPSSAQ